MVMVQRVRMVRRLVFDDDRLELEEPPLMEVKTGSRCKVEKC